MKRDNAPIALRRPLARLSHGLVTPKLLAAIKDKAPIIQILSALPKWHSRDPQGVWADFYRDMLHAYAPIMRKAGRDARVRKSVERVDEITVDLNPYAQKWAKQHGGELCVEMSQQQHDLVRQVIQRGYDAGARPEDMAAQLQRSIGLTSRQETAVYRYRENLDDGSYEDDELDALADRYAHKQLVYRSEMIGRTEERYAVEEGRRSEWLQARDDGEMPESAKRQWLSAAVSQRLCDICEFLDGQVVGLDEPFIGPDGEEYDSPPEPHPACRCTQAVVFD
jgi:hypothetical protein